MTATGFAVELDGEILMRTVSDTERAAQVNGLAMCFSVMPQPSWPDDMIEGAWLHWSNRLDIGHVIAIVPVTVERARCQ